MRNLKGSTPGLADRFYFLWKIRGFEFGMWNDHPRYWSDRTINGWYTKHVKQFFFFRISIWLRIP